MVVSQTDSASELQYGLFSYQADVVQQVEALLIYAVQQTISDIHIEPYGDEKYRIRVRKDGLLYLLAYLEPPIANSIVARLKVLSHLDVAEKRLPQDGHFSLKVDAAVTVDFRFSSSPTVDGEKTVIRSLNPETMSRHVEELGLEETQKQWFISALNRPQGLILFIGPTGSGKTVSLYAALQLLNPAEKNILTIEDPVEINVSGINQVNINPKIGLTFAAGLRAFLRQDPDVIVLGEIRDAETAQIVVKAAQTGHLVLSTLHAQNTVQAFDRLLNLGLSKMQIHSNLLLLMAQRLVRKLCNRCKVPQQLSLQALQQYRLSSQDTIFAAQGCEFCQAGYCGRTGVFELLPITKEIVHEFYQANHRSLMVQLLQKRGLLLRDMAMYKVFQGVTTLAEIDRVIPEEF